MSAAAREQGLWAARGWRSDLLLPVSWLFAALVALRRGWHRHMASNAANLRVPVVVVGNIAVGGTGKTPLLIGLVEALKLAGHRPGVISRGYGGSLSRTSNAWAMVEYGDASRYGDEMVLISKATGVPCAVSRQRIAAATGLLAAHPEVDVLLSDDGLQHYALPRRLEIAVFDERGIGNGRRLPAGPLREPVQRLAEVDAVVFNGDGIDLAPAWLLTRAPAVRRYRMQLHPGLAQQLIDPQQTRALPELMGRQLLALAAIGNPERFFRTLRCAGLSFTTLALADHAGFAPGFFSKLAAEIILITQKDAVKCVDVTDPRVWVVPVTAELAPDLIKLVLENLGASR